MRVGFGLERSYGHQELFWIQAANWNCVVYSSSGGFQVQFEEGENFTNWHGWMSLGIDDWEHPGAVSYWSLVLPLTLLSAWLIVAKPRSKSAKESSHA